MYACADYDIYDKVTGINTSVYLFDKIYELHICLCIYFSFFVSELNLFVNLYLALSVVLTHTHSWPHKRQHLLCSTAIWQTGCREEH